MDAKQLAASVGAPGRTNPFLKQGVLVTRRVSEEAVKILAYASGYHLKRST